MQSRENISKLIWQGRYWGKGGAMRAAYRFYRHLSVDIGARVTWMSDLYSALSHEQSGAKLGDAKSILRVFWCLWHLYPQVRFFAKLSEQRRGELTADQCDVVSTVLLQWGRELRNGPALAAAHDYAERGLRIPVPRGGHTRALLSITMAKIMIAQGNTSRAHACVDIAIARARDIEDANQKSRVLRNCAELVYGLRDEKWSVTPGELLDEADRVPGIARDVHYKNLQARLSLSL